jgi:hypothetical protein
MLEINKREKLRSQIQGIGCCVVLFALRIFIPRTRQSQKGRLRRNQPCKGPIVNRLHVLMDAVKFVVDLRAECNELRFHPREPTFHPREPTFHPREPMVQSRELSMESIEL